MKIYTKYGDKGETSLVSGERVPKYVLRVDAYGTVDELNSIIALAIAHCTNKIVKNDLQKICNELFSLCSDLSNTKCTAETGLLKPEMVLVLEKMIDDYMELIPPIQNFILPIGSVCSCFLHQARTVCRRAERLVVELAADEPVGPTILPYLNRLSDYFFTSARYVNFLSGFSETYWQKQKE
jgi:cob(I)alamin adenosyltransferase